MDERVKEYPDGDCGNSPWDLRQIVAELRTLRREWRQNMKPDGVAYELPSQKVLSDIVAPKRGEIRLANGGLMEARKLQTLGVSRICSGASGRASFCLTMISIS